MTVGQTQECEYNVRASTVGLYIQLLGGRRLGQTSFQINL